MTQRMARGVAFEAGTSRKLKAQLVAGPAGVRLYEVGADQGTDPFSTGEMLAHGAPVVRERVGRDVVLIFEGGARFETRDVDAVHALLGTHSSDKLSSYEAWHPRLLGFVALTFLGAIAMWKWAIPLLVTIAISLTPPGFVAAIDSSNMEAIDLTFADPSTLSAAEQAEVLEIFNRVAAQAPAPPFGEYVLEFRDLGDLGPNAFALPGGTMVMSDALVRMFPDDDVIASVLGHELAHVSQVHSLEQLYRSLSVYVLVVLIVGDAGPILEDILLEGGVLLSLSFSRQHETEADEIGVRTAQAAGYDPRGLVTFFEELEKEFGAGGPSFMSTHPSHTDRIDHIEELIYEIE